MMSALSNPITLFWSHVGVGEGGVGGEEEVTATYNSSLQWLRPMVLHRIP